jgi:hypothetical protein
MTIPAWSRLLLFILAGIVPVWAEFVATSQDWSPRGLLKPVLASVSVAVAVTLARTKNPTVDTETKE